MVLRSPDDEADRLFERTIDPLAQRRVEAVVDAVAIDAALADLPDEHRAAVVLRDVADLDYDEIAEILEIPLGTVKSRIARGRARLVRQLTTPSENTGNQTTPDERPTN